MVTVSFNSTCVSAKFAKGQLLVFAAAGNAAVVSGEIELAVPYTAAPALQNPAAQVAGKILVIRRGESSFQDKAERAQAAGAVGAIIVNNVVDAPRVMDINALTIPVVMVPISVDGALQASQGLQLTIAISRQRTPEMRLPSIHDTACVEA